ncbi:MAG: Sorbitol dehydrogenase [Firmicutes bacterium ADurb.Bin506]|jgi:L-iditol 2-dehydrogenase|nr:MAG: Sorbitol dehydrogenase [Firmicutes bacterium ADurb.Bin506]
MKTAVYYGPGKMEIEEWPVPEVGTDGILIKTRASMVCGTDVKTYARGHHMFKPPCVLGHEFSGEVVAVGPKVRAAQVGDRITAAPFINCGKCFYCRAGVAELCTSRRVLSNGSFSEYIRIDEEYAASGLIKLAPDTTWEEAALTEPLACVINAIDDMNITAGDTVAVVGAGPMGLLNAMVARYVQHGRVVVFETDELRRARVASLGFETADPAAGDAVAAVRALTDGRGADQVILAAGAVSAVPLAMSLARPGGRVMLFGGFPQGQTASFDPNLIHYKQVTVVGGSGFAPEHFTRAGEMINSHAFELSRLVSHKFTLDEIVDALAVAATPESIKVEIVFD